MSDILQEAEALIEKHSTSGYIHRDATLLLPGLVEEIKHLRVLECAAKANMTRRDEDIGDLMKELAKWQQIAIDRTAQIGWHTSCNCGRLPNDLRWAYCDWAQEIPQSVRDGWNEWAAKELGLQVDDTSEELTIAYMLGSKKANDRLKVLQDYVRRLEKEFLDHTAARIYYESIPGIKPYIPEDAEISTPMEYLIQGVLQDAISGKGWSLSQHQGLGKCGAVIRYHANFDPITGYGESPAKSLLAAYIAACEAVNYP